MCGRITLTATPEVVGQRFSVKVPEFKPNYNAAPKQMLPVIPAESPESAVLCRWGLIPHWAKDEKIGYKMINARAEGLSTSPVYRGLLERKRCLVIADGFYEWKGPPGKKTPYRITLQDGGLFAMAGLYDHWKHEETEVVTFTIITTTSNELMKPIHNRMPVLLPRENEQDWLGFQKKEALSLLVPYKGELHAYPVSKAVNLASNNSAELIKPAPGLFSEN